MKDEKTWQSFREHFEESCQSLVRAQGSAGFRKYLTGVHVIFMILSASHPKLLGLGFLSAPDSLNELKPSNLSLGGFFYLDHLSPKTGIYKSPIWDLYI